MANENYILEGAASTILFSGATGADVALSFESISTGGFVVSAQYDLGADPRAYLFAWVAQVQFQASPTVNKGAAFYLAVAQEGRNTSVTGNVGTTEDTTGDAAERGNLIFLGNAVSVNGSASDVCRAQGVFECYHRYISICAYNFSGATTNATDTNFRFDLMPISYQQQ